MNIYYIRVRPILFLYGLFFVVSVVSNSLQLYPRNYSHVDITSGSSYTESFQHRIPDSFYFSLRRELGGDFDELNNLFDGLVLALPDFYIDAGTFLGATVNIWTSDLTCFSLSVEDILIDYGRTSITQFDFGVDIKGLAISCSLNYRYKWSFTSGSGKAQIYSTNNEASTTIRFYSENYDEFPPTGSSVSECVADIQIDDMDFQGGIVAGLLDTFEKSLRGTIESELKSAACDELGSLGTKLVSDMLDLVHDLLARYLGPLPIGYDDILNAERSLNIPDDIDLIDFSNIGDDLIGGNVGDIFQSALKLADTALGSYTSDPGSPTENGQDLGINKLLRDFVLRPDRSIGIDIELLSEGPFSGGVIFEGSDMLTETTITMTEISVFGLDTFQIFNPLNSVGNYTLSNSFFWSSLSVLVKLDIFMKPSQSSNSVIAVGNGVVQESIEIMFKLNDIQVDLSFLLGVDEVLLGKVQLGQVLELNSILPCFLKTLYDLEITGFSVAVNDIANPTMDGFISAGIDRIISNAAEAVFLMYEPSFIRSIPNIFQITIRNILNDFINQTITDVRLASTCPIFNSTSVDDQAFVNLHDLLEKSYDNAGSSAYGMMIPSLVTYIREEITKINSTSQDFFINDWIRSSTKKQSDISGSLSFPGIILDYASEVDIGEFNAEIELRLSRAMIVNLDSFGLPLSILNPESEITMTNIVSLGANQKPLGGYIEISVGVSNDGDYLMKNVFGMSIQMKDVIVNVTVLLAALESAFKAFPMEDMDVINCWLALMPAPTMDQYGIRLENSITTLALQKLGINIHELKLEIECIECAPKFAEFADRINVEDSNDDLTDIANRILNYFSDLLGGSFFQSYLDHMLANSSRRCPHSPDFLGLDAPSITYEKLEAINMPRNDFTYMTIIGAIIASMVVIACLIVVVVKVVRSRRRKAWLASLDKTAIHFHLARQEEEDSHNHALNDCSRSMFRSTSIPLFVRILVPLVIIINIGLFLSGHLNLGATVDVSAQVAGETFKIKKLFVFSMAQSVIDMWDAGAKELAVVIALFSGVWPYTKQLVVLFLWFAGPKVTSVSKRGSIFLWLDRLGKWSFIDIFILVMSVASFRLQLESPNGYSMIPNNFYDLQLFVLPCWGLYSNMIAQIVSQINSHVMIHYHRKIISEFENRLLDEDERTTLCKHHFKREFTKSNLLMTTRSWVNATIVFLSILFVISLFTGSVLPAFSLTQQGLIGIIVDAAGDSKTFHNIMSIIHLLLNQAIHTNLITDYIGLGFLAGIFVATVVLVPLLQLLFLLQRWFRPLSERDRMNNFVIVEVLYSWQYLEVFLVSILIACWQLGNVSNFLINDYCESLNSTFQLLSFYGVLSPEDAQCFRVVAKAEIATWFLVCTSVLLLIVTHFIQSAANEQNDDLRMDSSTLPIIVPLRKESLSRSDEAQYSRSISWSDDSKLTRDVHIAKLRPTPPRFSDFYRWFLTKSSSSRSTTI